MTLNKHIYIYIYIYNNLQSLKQTKIVQKQKQITKTKQVKKMVVLLRIGLFVHQLGYQGFLSLESSFKFKLLLK